MNISNRLTIIRVCLVPVFVIMMLVPISWGNYLAVLVFVMASVTDSIDGHLARKNNLITDFGKFMDPIADKLLVCSALICLVSQDSLPAWVAIIIIGREFIISGFRLVASDKGNVIAASYWGKFKTVSQMIMIIMLILNFGGIWNTIAYVITIIALILTVVSLADYLRKNWGVLDGDM